MVQKIREFFLLALISILPTLLLWLPFLFRVKSFWGVPLSQDGMATIVSNYDGPLYLVAAKTLYFPEAIKQFPFNLPVEYYAAHFPLFPILIRLFSGFLGYPYSMLFVTVISSVLATYFFFKLVSEYVSKENAFWATFAFSIFPARYLIVRSVGSADPLFLAGLIASVYYFKNKKYLLSGVWGAVAQFTKSPGILLFISYFLVILIPALKRAATTSAFKISKLKNYLKFTGLLLIPLALFTVFYIYKIRLNDFWAYFHSGDNIHLQFPPFQIFNYTQVWVGTFWLEEIIFIYLFGILGLLRLIKNGHPELSYIVAVFFTSILFVSHRDLLRYALPIVPFLFIAFAEEITSKEFKFALTFLILPIYLFSLAYISQNVMPVGNWAPLL